MNRHERRKAAATGGAQIDRQRTIAAAADIVAQAAATDGTVTGVTILLPDGEVVYLAAPSSPQATAQ